MRQFQAGAERFGYILIGSNNLRNGPWEVALNAIKAISEDAQRRFSIDRQRIYLTGFSGGARFAGQFALGSKVQGVIACGAGFSGGVSSQEIPFVFLGIAGNWDMNYFELNTLIADLQRRKVTSKFLTFDGGHMWPPKEICTKAVEWIELEAMRDKLRGKDEKMVEALFLKAFEDAEKLEQSGQIYPAYRSYSALAYDFRDLRDLERVNKIEKRLRKSPAVKRALKKATKIEKLERRHQSEILMEMFKSERSKSLDWWEKKIRSIEKMKEKAADADHDLLARRLLEFIWRNGYERSWFSSEEQAYSRARYMAELSVLVRPEAPNLLYNLARTCALDGREDKALVTLRRATTAGFDNLERIRKDPAFVELRQNPRFRKIVEALKTRGRSNKNSGKKSGNH